MIKYFVLIFILYLKGIKKKCKGNLIICWYMYIIIDGLKKKDIVIYLINVKIERKEFLFLFYFY